MLAGKGSLNLIKGKTSTSHLRESLNTMSMYFGDITSRDNLKQAHYIAKVEMALQKVILQNVLIVVLVNIS